MLEALTDHNIYNSSGVIIEKDANYYVLTAGHCLAFTDTGKAKLCKKLRIKFPRLPEYHDITERRARFKKKSKRFNNVMATKYWTFPDYMTDLNSRQGTDIGN